MVHDFHGLKTSEALLIVEQIISKVRQNKTTELVSFITGHGVIRDEVLKLLQSYNLSAKLQIGNDGVIIVMIE